MTRIAVVGPGAIGGVAAAHLAQNPAHDVTLCVRTPFSHLVVDTPHGQLRAAPHILADAAKAEPVDWALVCTKTYDVDGAALWLARLMAAHTRVAVLQNGVEHVERFASYVPPEQIVPIVVDIPAERSAPGVVRQRRDGTMLAPAGAAGDAFVSLFAHSPIDVQTTPDFRSAAWRKLCINSTGVANALTRKPNGLSRDDAVAAVMRALIGECVAVGRAEGAVLSDDLPREIVDGYRAGPPDGVNSLLADRLAGRPMELDARNGVIVRYGAKHGVATPMNAALVALLEAAAA